MAKLLNRTPWRYLLATFVLTIMQSNSWASPLDIEIFNPGADAIFPVTSTLIYGEHDAILIDAQFQKSYARELVKRIKATGKTLKLVFVSHSDPDYYFGLDEIAEAFPGVRIVSTAQTAYLISASKDAKLQVWRDRLGPDAPDRLIVPKALPGTELSVDGEKILVQQDPADPAHSFLWVPSSRTVLGGISVTTGEHLWMADTPSVKDIDRWIRVVDKMESLRPQRVVPGHFRVADTSPKQLTFVVDYLKAYRLAASSGSGWSEIVSVMTKAYPDLAGAETLVFGAKVFTGDVPWHTMGPYPPIGMVAEVTFGDTVFELTFLDNETMSFEGVAGPSRGVKDTVKYTAVEVSRGVFMVYWHEPHIGSNVVHVQDWNTGTVYTNISASDNSFLNLRGNVRIK